MSAPIATDVLVIGAGPVGLFQAFQLGLQDIRCHIVDSLPHPGGQCTELYPEKPIYDIPAVPVCTGKELTDNLLKQIEPFGATFHLGQEVSVVDKREDGGYVTPIECVGDFATFISRIRQDSTIDNGLNLWCVSDNLRKGAALNAVQVAELLGRECLKKG